MHSWKSHVPIVTDPLSNDTYRHRCTTVQFNPCINSFFLWLSFSSKRVEFNTDACFFFRAGLLPCWINWVWLRVMRFVSVVCGLRRGACIYAFSRVGGTLWLDDVMYLAMSKVCWVSCAP